MRTPPPANFRDGAPPPSVPLPPDGFRTTLALFFAAGLIIMLVCTAVSDLVTSRDEVFRGTFTLEYIDTTGRHHDKIGRWVSEDGTIVVEGARLDGALDYNDTALATYKPTGFLNDSITRTVMTDSRREVRYVWPWLACAGLTGILIIVFRVRRGIRRERLAELQQSTDAP